MKSIKQGWLDYFTVSEPPQDDGKLHLVLHKGSLQPVRIVIERLSESRVRVRQVFEDPAIRGGLDETVVLDVGDTINVTGLKAKVLPV